MNVSPRQLRIFVSLAQSLNFGSTAHRFGVTQPTMSRIITELETELGVRLFERTTRNVKISPEGHELLEVAKRLSQDYDDGMLELAQIARQRTHRISVAALPTLAALLLPAPIARIRALKPDVIVNVHDVYADAAIDLLRKRTVDFALSSVEPIQEELEYQGVTQERFEILVSKKLVSTIDPDAWTSSTIAGLPVIAMRRGTSTRNSVDEAFRKRGLSFHPFVELQNLTSIAHFVLSGIGLTILPKSAVHLIKTTEMHSIPLGDVAERAIGVITRKGSRHSRMAEKFIEDAKIGLEAINSLD